MRRFLAIVAGLVAAFLVTSAVHWLGNSVYPLPEGLDMADREAMADYVETMPFGAFLFVLAAHAAGAMVGAFLCTKIGRRFKAGGLAIGGLWLLAGIANLMMIPHPIWFAVVDVLVYLPAAMLGVRVACGAPANGGGPGPEPAA